MADLQQITGQSLNAYRRFAAARPLAAAGLCVAAGAWVTQALGLPEQITFISLVATVIYCVVESLRDAARPRPARTASPSRQQSRPAPRHEGPRNVLADLRTRAGNRYRFSFEKTGVTWLAYIVNQPGYGVRSATLQDTHRLRDADRYYICWAGDVTALSQMRGIAQIWAESTDRYIATGRRFG